MKTHYITLCLLTLLFTSGFQATGQTIQCDSPYPNCFGLNDIFFTDSENGWAVGSLGIVSRYDGTEWTQDLNQDKTQKRLRKSFFLDANTGWIIGEQGTILKYKDDVYTLQTSGTTYTLHDVYFTDENHGWAVGDYNIILKYTNGVWTTEKATDPSSNFPLYAIYMNSATKGWAVGYEGNMYVYNGTSWIKRTSPTTETLYDIEFSDSLGYAVGTSGMVIKYNLNNSWLKVPGQANFVYDLFAVEIRSASNVWTSGSYGTLIHYNGTTWSEGSANGVWYTGLSMVSDTEGWTFGDDGSIYKINNGVVTVNNTVFQNANGTPYQNNLDDLEAMALKPDGSGWVLGYYGQLFELKNNVIKKQADVLSSDNTYNSIAAFNDTLAFIVGNEGTIYKYNGTTWSLVTTPFQASLSSVTLYKVFIMDATHVYIVGSGGTLLRYGSGVWEKIPVTGVTTNLYDVQFLDANTGWVVGAGGKIAKYKDGVFTVLTYPNTNNIVRVYFFDETEGWTISNSGLVRYKNNAWATVSSDQTLVKDFHFIDKNNGYIIGPPYFDGGAGGVVTKFTNGTCQKVPNYKFVQNFSSIQFFSPTQALILGEEGLLLRIGVKPDVVVTSIDENIFSSTNKQTVYQLVPNPANHELRIYKEGFPLLDQHVAVTGINGQVFLEQSINGESLSIAGLPKGMYFLRLTQNNTVLKFIKE